MLLWLWHMSFLVLHGCTGTRLCFPYCGGMAVGFHASSKSIVAFNQLRMNNRLELLSTHFCRLEKIGHTIICKLPQCVCTPLFCLSSCFFPALCFVLKFMYFFKITPADRHIEFLIEQTDSVWNSSAEPSIEAGGTWFNWFRTYWSCSGSALEGSNHIGRAVSHDSGWSKPQSEQTLRHQCLL